MTNLEYKNKYKHYLDLFNSYSEKVFCDVKSQNNLAKAMKYSYFAGGKRIRPVLALAFAEILGGDLNQVLPIALAVECVHTYSLVHDDLPALDNDVLRRGKPTCHVEFDESTAILAGDALLNFAFEHALINCKDFDDVQALSYLAKYSGYRGMLSGQQTDIESEKTEGSEDLLLQIHDLKTCKLLTVPLVVSAIKFDKTKICKCEELGKKIGLIFQFTDDVLDVYSSQEKLGKSIGKDDASGKFTSVKLYGIGGVKEKISILYKSAQEIAKSLDDTGFLQCFINKIYFSIQIIINEN